MPIVSDVNFNKEFLRLVTEGKIPGHRYVTKFGENLSISDTVTLQNHADIWDFGGMYSFSTTADISSISSSDAADTMPVLLFGLDEDWNRVTQVVVLQGTTRVDLSTSLIRIYRMENLTTTGQQNVGTIYCYSGTDNTAGVPSGSSVVKAIIKPYTGQTQMAIMSVPVGEVAFLESAEVGFGLNSFPISSTEQARVHFMVRSFNNVFKVKKTKRLMSTGVSSYRQTLTFKNPIPEKSDIKLSISQASETIAADASFDLLFVEKSYVSESVLESIGMTA